MLIFIIISLISRHLICLPAASVDDRQLYLGIVPTSKNLHFSPESFFIYILVISELTGYVLAPLLKQKCFACPTWSSHTSLVTCSLWHSPGINSKGGTILQPFAHSIWHHRNPKDNRSMSGQIWACIRRLTGLELLDFTVQSVFGINFYFVEASSLQGWGVQIFYILLSKKLNSNMLVFFK